jgi:hypothetical protein
MGTVSLKSKPSGEMREHRLPTQILRPLHLVRFRRDRRQLVQRIDHPYDHAAQTTRRRNAEAASHDHPCHAHTFGRGA